MWGEGHSPRIVRFDTFVDCLRGSCFGTYITVFNRGTAGRAPKLISGKPHSLADTLQVFFFDALF